MRARLSINPPPAEPDSLEADTPRRGPVERKRRSGPTPRVILGRLFGQWRSIIICGVFGALIAAAWCSWTPIIWNGRLELAIRAGEGDDRPDPVTLRATLLDPANLAALLPGSPAGPDPALESWLLGVERGVRIEPAVTTGAPAVWRVVVDIPAPVRAQAQTQLDEYLRRVRGRIDPAYLVERPVPFDGSPLIAAGGFGDDGLSHRERLSRYRELEAEIEALERRATELAEDVSRLAPLLDGPERVALAALNGFPTLKDIAEQIARVEDRRSRTRSLRETHPNVRELSRKRDALIERFKDAVREQQAELKQKRESLDRNLTSKRRDLQETGAALGALTPPKRSGGERPPPKTNAAGPASLPVGIRSEARPSTGSSGGLVVAGPIVESTPARPAYFGTILTGLIFGLGFGVALGVVKSIADQRLFDPEEIDGLGIELTLLGTIPQRSGPVVTVGDSL